MKIRHSELLRATIVTLAGGLVLSAAASQDGPRIFATPQAAAEALVDAAVQNDTVDLMSVVGAEGRDTLEPSDDADDSALRVEFGASARARLQVVLDRDNPDRATLGIGEQGWPFPVLLVRTDGGWSFDIAAGRAEILTRRIGANELAAINICRAYVEAQKEYARRPHDASGLLVYAQRIVSSPDKQDGLDQETESEGLVLRSFIDAASRHVPCHGYFFRILTSQGPDALLGEMDYVVNGEMIGGYALVAWPAEYGVSGVQTLMVNQQGVVYSKDLGPDTATAAAQITAFNPDKSWIQP